MAGRPLQALKVHPVLPIGSDCTHLITPTEPVRICHTGGPAVVMWQISYKALLKTLRQVLVHHSASA